MEEGISSHNRYDCSFPWHPKVFRSFALLGMLHRFRHSRNFALPKQMIADKPAVGEQFPNS
jgi:hypothetical protein